MGTKYARDLFTGMLRSAGLPVTEAEMRATWAAINAEEGTQVKNTSPFSPFWRLVTALVTRPCMWLVDLLVDHALPNVFLRFAGGVYLDVFVWAVGILRKPGAIARGRVLFTRASAVGELLIPAGTWIESPPLDGTVYRVATLADAVIPQGQLALEVEVDAEAEGEAWNLGPGYYSILPLPLPGIVNVTTLEDWLVTPGADVETDEPLRLRARNQFMAVGQLHHDAAYKALISTFSGIRVDYLFFEKDGPRGPGTANCHMMIESGVPPAPLVESINAYVMASGNHGHGDDLLCMPITPAPFSLQVTAYPVLSAGVERQEQLLVEVENRIRCAFRQNTDYTMTKVYPLSRFSLSRLGDELHEALPDLRSIEFGRQEDITSQLSLPVLEDLTIRLGEGV